jgi:KaiC/GvpD/RAD55 family RecA-like ATPase
MARVQTDTEIGAEALRTVAGPKVQAVQVAADPNKSSAFQLAASLGAAQPVLDKFQDDYERRKLQEQLLKVDAYKERFRADNASGDVSATQVGKMFPETVPTVRARIAEGAGYDYGKTLIQPVLDSILQDDSIRLDTAKRTEFLKTKRAELFQGIQGDDFYKSGAIRAIDAELKTYENTWQQQTATYHQEIQAKDFRSKVSTVFTTYGDVNGVGKALEDLDAQWKASSSLNNLERNKLVIDEVTKLAFNSDNPAMLDRIPERFLNTETKAELKQMKVAIEQKRITDFRNGQYIIGVQREEAVRSGKLKMIEDVEGGKPVNPYDYKDNPELYSYATEMMNVARIPEVSSVASAQTVRTAILDGSTFVGMSQSQVVDALLTNPTLNPKEKKELIAEVPKLLEGRIAMDDPMVKNVIDLRINPALKALEGSTNSRIQNIITGENLRGQAIRVFEVGIRDAFTAYFQDNKRWPTGKAKLDIVDAMTEKAEKYIADRTKIGGSIDIPAPAPAPAPSVAPSQAPAPAPASNKQTIPRPIPTQADIDYAKKNPQVIPQFRLRFGREP